jgi:hypothetical protein
MVGNRPRKRTPHPDPTQSTYGQRSGDHQEIN